MGFSEKIKEIDFSDLRLMLVALILLSVPTVFFIHKFATSGDAARSQGSNHQTATSSRKGFSFSGASDAGSSGAPVKSMFLSEKAGKEWESEISKVLSAPSAPTIPPGTPPSIRYLIEAEHDESLRESVALIEEGRPRDALPLLIELMKSDNPFIRVSAASNLCAAYQELGNQKELDDTFEKLAEFLAELPPGSGFTANMLGGLKELSKCQELLAKASVTPESRKILEEILKNTGFAPKVSPQALGEQSPQIFKENIPALDRFKNLDLGKE